MVSVDNTIHLTERTANPPWERSKYWLGIAIGSLTLAGLFSLVPLIGRIPGLSTLISDTLFARRCLVVHVNLALFIWIYSFIAALFHLIPAKISYKSPPYAIMLAILALTLLVFSAGLPGGRPILSNYIPVIDHPLFLVSLIIFGAALILTFLDNRILPGYESDQGQAGIPPAIYPGLRVAAIACLLAMLTFVAAWITTPTHLPAPSYYEALVWGGGHVLQAASVAGMLSVWLILLSKVLGESPVSRKTASFLFSLLLLPLIFAPNLALYGSMTGTYRMGFSKMMQWGIFPVVSIFLVICFRALYVAYRKKQLTSAMWKSTYMIGFLVSATLTILGFVLGAMIRGSNTMIPAHYHASIGGVSASYMAMTYVFFKNWNLRLPGKKLKNLPSLQLKLFGIGQMIFACGFGYAGAHGMLRKVYGSEQHIRSLSETIGLGLMGGGGILAITGGLLFLGLGIYALTQTIIKRQGDLYGKRQNTSNSEATRQSMAVVDTGTRHSHPFIHRMGAD